MKKFIYFLFISALFFNCDQSHAQKERKKDNNIKNFGLWYMAGLYSFIYSCDRLNYQVASVNKQIMQNGKYRFFGMSKGSKIIIKKINSAQKCIIYTYLDLCTALNVLEQNQSVSSNICPENRNGYIKLGETDVSVECSVQSDLYAYANSIVVHIFQTIDSSSDCNFSLEVKQ